MTGRKLLSLLACSALWVLPNVATADDALEFRDGTRLHGELIELGGAELKLRVRGGEKVVLRKEIKSVTFDQNRVRREAAESDAIIRQDGFRIEGKVEILQGGDHVQVTLPSGGRVKLAKSKVFKIIRKGDSIGGQNRIYTKQLGDEVRAALARLLKASDKTAIAKEEEFLAACGVFAIDAVRSAQVDVEVDDGKSDGVKQALERIDRLYRLKEVVSPTIEQYDSRVFEILASDDRKQKESFLFFVFYRFVDDSVRLAQFLAMDPVEDKVIRSYSIDFLRRMQRNRELIDIYRRSRGQVQFACAIALGKNQVLHGLPTLIEALQMRDVRMRALAVKHLRAFTNENFRFRPDGAPEARKQAADRWLEWWRENEEDLNELSLKAMREGNEETPERRKARQLWQAASLAVSNEDIKFAEKLLNEALEVDPRFLRAQICLAMLYLTEVKNPQRALDLLETIENQKRPGLRLEDKYWIRLYTGHCRQLLGDLAGARREYEECVLYGEGKLEGHVSLAQASYKAATLSDDELSKSEREAALKASLKSYQKAVELIEASQADQVTFTVADLPVDSEPLFDRRQHNRAVVDIRKRNRLDLQRYSFSIAKIQYILNQKSEAVATLEARLPEIVTYRKEPELKALEIEIRNFLGLLYEDTGDLLKALRTYRVVLRVLDSENAQSRLALQRMRRRDVGTGN